MFCGNCGKQIQDNAAVCPYCGAPTGAANSYGAQSQPYNQNSYGGAQSQPRGNRNYGGQSQSRDRQSYGSQAHSYSQNNYSAPGYEAYGSGNAAGGIPENGFDSVNKVIQAKLGFVDNRPVTHPFQRLGGFLAVATYRWGIMALLLTYNTIQILTSISSVGAMVSSFTGGAGTGAITGIMFLILVVMAGVIAVNFLMFFFLEKKNTVFLKFYEIVGIVVVSLVVLLSIVIMIGANSMGPVSGTVLSMVTGILIPVIFWVVAWYGLWILYFGKSVRVRTYFGTDEYLRRSIFCRKSQYPVPFVPDRPFF